MPSSSWLFLILPEAIYEFVSVWLKEKYSSFARVVHGLWIMEVTVLHLS